MVPTKVLLADPPGETVQTELSEHNPFASRSSTSSVTVPTQGQAECSAEGDSPRVAGSLLRHPRRAKQIVFSGQLSSSTDPVEALSKEQSTATPVNVQVGVHVHQSAPMREHSV